MNMMNNGVIGGMNPQMGGMGMNGQMGGMGMNPQMGGMGMNPQMGGMGMNGQMGMDQTGMNMQMMGMNGQIGGNGMNMGQMGQMGMMGMNPQMGGNGMNMGQMGMNPQMGQMGMMGMNPQMGQMGMMPGMMGMMPGMMGMQKQPLTEEQKKQIKMQGYLMGKKMAEERKKNQQKKQKPAPATPAPATGEITVKFKKGGSVTDVKLDVKSMVAELLNEYFTKSGTTNGTFKFNGNTLSPMDTSTLADVGLNNNSEIIVS